MQKKITFPRALLSISFLHVWALGYQPLVKALYEGLELRDPMLVLEVNGSRVPLSSLLKRFMLKSLSKRSMKRSEEKKIAAAVMLKPNLRPLPR